jgi:adenylate kinase
MILLMGIAGSGKSMQGRLFADEQGFAWLSTGELLRILVTGKRRHEMLRGMLLDDKEMIKILDKVFDLINLSEEFVLDGFPRTVVQAMWLLEQIKKDRLHVDVVINLIADQNVVRKRLHTRGRTDDTDDAINHRLEEHNAVNRPIIELFKEQDLPVYDIDANKAPQAVHDAIWKHIKALNIVANDNEN